MHSISWSPKAFPPSILFFFICRFFAIVILSPIWFNSYLRMTFLICLVVSFSWICISFHPHKMVNLIKEWVLIHNPILLNNGNLVTWSWLKFRGKVVKSVSSRGPSPFIKDRSLLPGFSHGKSLAIPVSFISWGFPFSPPSMGNPRSQVKSPLLLRVTASIYLNKMTPDCLEEVFHYPCWWSPFIKILYFPLITVTWSVSSTYSKHSGRVAKTMEKDKQVKWEMLWLVHHMPSTWR